MPPPGTDTDNSDDFLDIDPAALARAEAALAALSCRYLAWAEADLLRLEACLTEILAAPDGRAAGLKLLFGIAHDMKGQGATFDYPLVSVLGNRLCRLVESDFAPGPEHLASIAVLVAGIGRVIRERISGDGGEIGRVLLGE